MKVPVIPLRYVLAVVCLLVMISYVTPFSQCKTISYLDIVNGRRMTVEKNLGFVTSSQVEETHFSKLVSDVGLEDEPDWVIVSDVGSDIFGNPGFNFMYAGSRFLKPYEDFASIPFPRMGMSNPTTAVLEMRRLAKKDDGDGLRLFVAQLQNAYLTHKALVTTGSVTIRGATNENNPKSSSTPVVPQLRLI